MKYNEIRERKKRELNEKMKNNTIRLASKGYKMEIFKNILTWIAVIVLLVVYSYVISNGSYKVLLIPYIIR